MRAKLLRTMGVVIVYGLAAFGGLQLLIDMTWHFPSVDSSSAPPAKGVNFPSPAGNYKAVMFTWGGGPVPASYCLQFLSVVPIEYTDAEAWRDENHVVESGCDGIKKVSWTSERILTISINPTLGASNIKQMTLKNFARGGNIEIGYAQ